jgi:hypothetical protein
MTQIEDQLRSAFRAKAGEITPPPPPLELQPRLVHDPATHRGSGGLGTPRQRPWIVPLAAAVAVLAVVAGALALASVRPAHRTPPVLPPTTPIQASVPPYYVALTSDRPMTVRKPQAWPVLTTATLRATSTGAVLATVVPPEPYREFVFVSASAGDRYFMLAAQYGQVGESLHDGFFLLHIDPTAADPAERTSLTPFPTAALSDGDQLQAMALSPDGRLLATIALHQGKEKHGQAMETTYLKVYNLVNGQSRTWTGGNVQQDYVIAGSGGLSWRQDGRFLVVPWSGSQLRLLNVTAPGHSVARDSTPLATPPVPCSGFCLTYMTPDVKTVFAVYPTGRATFVKPLFYNLVRFSVQTGALIRINKLTVSGWHSRYTGYNIGSVVGPDDVLWTSYDGSKAIVAEVRPGVPNAGIYSGSRYTPIPWPANIVGAAW